MNIFVLLNKIKFVPLHFVFWVLVWVFYSYFFGFNSNNQKYVFWFSSVLIPITIVNTYFWIYYLIPNYLITKKYGIFILYSSYALIVSAYIISLAMFFGLFFLTALDFKEMPPISRSLPFVLLSVYLVVIVVSAFKLVKHNYLSLEKNKTLENKFLQTQLLLKEEELKFLKMQIHPHFLFNTLNTLYGFALKKANETPEMILKLANLLDYILYQIDKPKVFLTEELNHIEDYISLEKMRFTDTLTVIFNSNNIDESFQIAPMILMPFVENSFKHGTIVNGILNIFIEVKTTKNELVFSIKNSTNKNHEDSNGIGLTNIKKRLEMLYSNQYKLEINNLENTFEVILKINKNGY
jgi:sensor histidine kinase YesM